MYKIILCKRLYYVRDGVNRAVKIALRVVSEMKIVDRIVPTSIVSVKKFRSTCTTWTMFVRLARG